MPPESSTHDGRLNKLSAVKTAMPINVVHENKFSIVRAMTSPTMVQQKII
jgi:hypothetical protein